MRTEQEEFVQLRREHAILKQERDFLKRAGLLREERRR
jgi:hypothetical protein